MPLRDALDAFELFKKHGAAFDAAATFADFIQAPDVPRYLTMYAGGWAEQAFKTAKAGKTGVYRPLDFPTAARFQDLFTAAYFLPASIDSHRGKIPHGARFLSGSRGGAPCGHVGGRRGYTPGTDTRCHYGATFYGTYVVPRPKVKEDAEAYFGEHHMGSFEAIPREDGILIICRNSNGIGEVWLALLDRDADVSTMFDDETRALIAGEKQAALDAWGEI